MVSLSELSFLSTHSGLDMDQVDSAIL